MKRNSGITLIELIAVLVIVGILAAIALPRFPRAIEATKAKEAAAALQQIRTGERIYRNKEGFFYPHYEDFPGPVEDEAVINQVLKVVLDQREKDWRYEVNASTTDTFTATAIRTSGSNSGEMITIDQGGTAGGNWTP